MLAGVWNALWHGLRHLDQFWGLAALVSGLLMMVAATRLLVRGQVRGNGSPEQGGHAAGAGVGLLVLTLLVCFGLYAITLVRLNLGLSIPGA